MSGWPSAAGATASVEDAAAAAAARVVSGGAPGGDEGSTAACATAVSAAASSTTLLLLLVLPAEAGPGVYLDGSVDIGRLSAICFFVVLLAHLMLQVAPFQATSRFEPGRKGTALPLQVSHVKDLTYVLAQADAAAGLLGRLLPRGTTPARALHPGGRTCGMDEAGGAAGWVNTKAHACICTTCSRS